MRRLAYLLSLIVIIACTNSANVCSSDFSAYTGLEVNALLDDGDGNRWSMGQSYTTLSYQTQQSGVRWSWKLTQSLPFGDFRWGRLRDRGAFENFPSLSDAGELSGRVFFRENYVQTTVGFETLKDELRANVTWRRDNANRDDVSASVRAQLLPILWGAFEIGRGHPLPSFSELFFVFEDPSSGATKFEGGRVDWRAPADIRGFRVDIYPVDSVYVEWKFTEANLRPDEPEPGETPFGSYLGVLDGYWSDRRLRLGYRNKPATRVNGEYRRMKIDSRVRGFNGGNRFANFGVADARGEQFGVELERGRMRAQFYRGKASGEFKGVVEAWPFLDGLLRFLGERRHFVGEGSIEWTLARVGGDLLRRRQFELRSAIVYLRVSPDLRYTTWRPVFLGFGVDDLRSGQIDLVRADLIRLELNPRMTWKRWLFDLKVSQWVPISTRERDKPGGSSTPPPNSVEEASRSGGINGLSFSISVVAAF